MGSTSKLCEIADAGPLVHTMSWEEIGKACGDASLRIAELESLLREIDAKVVFETAVADGTGNDLQRRIEAALGIGTA